jgi:Flp pilus assembly protein TadG
MRKTGRTRQSGNAAIEFALSAGFLLALFSGVFQFGYTFFVYNNLVNAVRAGARYASLRVFDSSTGTPSAVYVTAVRNMVIYGDPAGGAVASAPGLVSANVGVDVQTSNNVPVSVTVQIQNYRVYAVFTTFTFNGKPRLSYPYMGRYAPNE